MVGETARREGFSAVFLLTGGRGWSESLDGDALMDGGQTTPPPIFLAPNEKFIKAAKQGKLVLVRRRAVVDR